MKRHHSSDIRATRGGQNGVLTGLGAKLSQHQQFLRYLIIGASASALDVILFFLLYNFVGLTELLSQVISVSAAVILSFVTNARHNFKVNDRMALRLTSFVVVCAVGGLLGYFVILGAMSAGLDANIGKLLSLPVVFITQYVLNSRITFRRKTAAF